MSVRDNQNRPLNPFDKLDKALQKPDLKELLIQLGKKDWSRRGDDWGCAFGWNEHCWERVTLRKDVLVESKSESENEDILTVSSHYDVSEDFDALSKIYTEDKLNATNVVCFLANQFMESSISKGMYWSNFIEVLKMFPSTAGLSMWLSRGEAKLTRAEPRLQLQPPCSHEVTDGMSALLSVNDCAGSMSYQWKREGKELANNSFFSGVYRDVLLVKNACQGMEGGYCCYTNDNKLVGTFQLTIKFSDSKKKLLNKYKYSKEVSYNSLFQGTSTFIELALVHGAKNQVNDPFYYSLRGDVDDIPKMKTKAKYDDVFPKFKKGVLVIEGRPGCGKTTLTRKITREWAIGPKILRGAKEMYLVPLRFLASEKTNSISDILEYIYKDDPETSPQEEVKKLSRNQGEGACFVLDGLDEYKKRDCSEDVIYRLLHEEWYLSKAMIIVASRPVATATVGDRDTKRFEVLGFSNEQITKYLEEYKFDDGIKLPGLQSILEDHVNVRHMCYLPVHIAMICDIYNGNFGDKIFPSTETEVYKQFTLLTIKRMLRQYKQKRMLGRYKQNEDFLDIVSLEDLNIKYPWVWQSLKNVCLRAFNMTIESKQVESKIMKNRLFSDEEESNNHHLDLVTIDRLKSEHWYSFPHLTYQEFLAAYHLVLLDDVEQVKNIRDHVDKSEMLVVWKFYCGLKKEFRTIREEQKYKITEERLKCIMSSENIRKDDLYRFQCALESRHESVFDAAFRYGEFTKQKKVRIENHYFQSADFSALGISIASANFSAVGHSIADSSYSVNHLELANCTITLEGVKQFVKDTGDKKLKQINSFTFSTSVEEGQFEALNYLLMNLESLKYLDLEGMSLQESSIQSLTDGLDLKEPQLEIIKLRMPLIGDNNDGLKMLNNAFQNLKEVHYRFHTNPEKTHKRCISQLIDSFNCKIIPLDDSFPTILCNLNIKLPQVSFFVKMSHVLLVNCDIDDDFIIKLSEAKITHCEVLRLDFNRIKCAGIKHFSKQCISNMEKLTCLSIACNQIGDTGAKALTGDLRRRNTPLTELNLQGNDISNAVADDIAQAVQNSQQLATETVQGEATVLKYWSSASIKNDMVFAWKYVSVEGVAKALGCCKYLHTLDLSGKIKNFCSSEPVQNLKLCRNLKRITFRSCLNDDLRNGMMRPITEAGFKNIIQSLSHCKLQALHLSFCVVSERDAVVLAKSFIPTEHISDFNKRWSLRFDTKDITFAQHIATLDLGNNYLSSNGAKVLGYGLQYCQKLKSLNLCSNGIEAKAANMLANGLTSCKSLQALTMDDNPLGADGAAEIIDAIKSCPDLNALSFSNTKLVHSKELLVQEESGECFQSIGSLTSVKAINGLGICMRNWINFEKLNLSKNCITYEGAVLLAESLQRATKLNHLDLGYNLLYARGMAIVIDSIKYCGLKYLKLGFNKISESHDPNFEGVEVLTETLRKKFIFTNLQILDLSFNKISFEGINALKDGFRCQNSLEILDLTGNGINAKGAELLTPKFGSFLKLNTLCLSKNNIGDEGAKFFVNSIDRYYSETVLKNIKELQLAHNHIGSIGASLLANRLKRFKNMSHLNLEKNDIGLEGAVAIAGMLKCCKNISHLNIRNNNIGSKGAVAIAKVLQHCKSITHLYIQDEIGKEGAAELAKGLKFCSNLQVLFVQDESMSLHNIRTIADSLDHCSDLEEYITERQFTFHSAGKYGTITVNYNRWYGDTWGAWKMNLSRL